jgi:hypothetical protein
VQIIRRVLDSDELAGMRREKQKPPRRRKGAKTR